MTYTRRVLLLDEELLPAARIVGLVLRTVDDPKSTRQIAAACGISESTAMRSLKALEERGWVRRIHPLWTATEDTEGQS